MKQARTKVGIIGSSGDLGSQLAARIHNAELFEVFINDAKDNGSTPLEVIMNTCSIVHVCAPLSGVEQLNVRDGQIIVLHDSVMNTSREFNANQLEDQAAIIHMLMNDHGTVVIASDAPHNNEVSKHMISLGYAPLMMTVNAHDELMARSQAMIAVLANAELSYLGEMQKSHLLTPSGEDLLRILTERFPQWTSTTLDSIARNPKVEAEIKRLLVTWDEMKEK